MTLRLEFLTDQELLRYLAVAPTTDPLVTALAERLEMRLREISDLQDDIQRLEDEVEHHDCDCDC